MLDDDTKRSLIEIYPPLQTVRYQPPNALPQAHARFSRIQAREDATLKSIQYQISVIFRFPLDVVAFELLDLKRLLT